MYISLLFVFISACSYLPASDVHMPSVGGKIKSLKIKSEIATKDLFKEVRLKYARYKMVEIDAKRKTTISALDKTKETDLKIYIASTGAIRIETKTEPKSITILNDTEVLVIDEPDEFFGGPIRVLRSKNAGLKNSQSFLRVIFGHIATEKVFNTKEEGKDFVILSAVNADFPVQTAKIVFDLKNKLISSIQYEDAQTNKIRIDLLHTKFKKSAKSKLFKYKIPKDAEVTEV